MACSPEQLAANRRNAQLSKGPTSEAGKLISRKNGYKHGLTGAGVVVADEDVEEVQARFEGFKDSLKPVNDVALFLTRRAAFLSFRLDRSAREEAARITSGMLRADEVEADARYEELDRIALLITQEPAEAVRKLRRTPEGIDRLIRGWENQKELLTNPSSAIGSGDVLYYLMGRHPANSQSCRVTVLIRALGFNFDWLSDWPDLPDHERKEMARGELVEIIDREIAGLRMAREGLDHERIAQIRAGAEARAIVSTSKEAILARRYEASDERNFHKALKLVEQINGQAVEIAEARKILDATRSERRAYEVLASSLQSVPGEAPAVEPAGRWARRVEIPAKKGGDRGRKRGKTVGSSA